MTPLTNLPQPNDRQQLEQLASQLPQYVNQIGGFITQNQYGFIVTEVNLIYNTLQQMRPIIDRLRAPNQNPNWELPAGNPAGSNDGGAFILGIIVGAVLVYFLLSRG